MNYEDCYDPFLKNVFSLKKLKKSINTLKMFLSYFNLCQPKNQFSEDSGPHLHHWHTHTQTVPVSVSVFDKGRKRSKASVWRAQAGGRSNYYTRGGKKTPAVNNS